MTSNPPAEAPEDGAEKPEAMHHETYREWRVLPISTLISIATIIGSGILALPVTLYATPIPVFLILFTVTLVAQIGCVYITLELLQRARQAIPPEQKSAPEDAPSSPSYESIEPRAEQQEVSLFALAHLYLKSRPLRYSYYVVTFFGFISLMVSYGLAGPQALWQLMTSGPTQSHPPALMFAVYWALGTGAVVFFVDQLLGVFGSLTVLKGGLFVGVVVIVAALPSEAKVASVTQLLSSFHESGNIIVPYLVSSVALGGLANTMPVTFKLVPLDATKAQVRRYRAAIVLAVVLCYLLNIGWVFAVLQAVPQQAEAGKPSLLNAYNKGQISTVPLIEALHFHNSVNGGVLRAVEIIVELFIFVSTGVSFFVMAAAMKSFMDGAVKSMTSGWQQNGPWKWGPTSLGYVFSFGMVLVIILTNPHGFIEVLTWSSSFALNYQAGLLVVIMFYNCRVNRNTESGAGGEGAAVESGTAQGGVGNTTGGIVLELKAFTATTLIVSGVLFFACSCLLVVAGPLLGIKVGAHE